MNAISYLYQVTYVCNSGKKKYCFKLPTDLGPGTLAYFLQSSLIQSYYMYPFVLLDYKITQRKQTYCTQKQNSEGCPHGFWGEDLLYSLNSSLSFQYIDSIFVLFSIWFVLIWTMEKQHQNQK